MSACAQVHIAASELTRYRFPFDPDALPANGIYLLFEKGEFAHDGYRIVRVGSHRGADNLPKRLNEHFLVENKDRSIFRKNVGRALLNRESDPFIEQWEWVLLSRVNRERYGPLIDRARLQAIEGLVTDFITSQCSFVVIPATRVATRRLALEAGLIATVAQCESCGPSPGWLGQFSPKATIRRTGLWQIQHVNDRPLAMFPPQDP